MSNVPIVAGLRDNPVAIADFSTRALETNNLEDYRNRLGRSYYGAKRPGRFRSRWFAPRRSVESDNWCTLSLRYRLSPGVAAIQRALVSLEIALVPIFARRWPIVTTPACRRSAPRLERRAGANVPMHRGYVGEPGDIRDFAQAGIRVASPGANSEVPILALFWPGR